MNPESISPRQIFLEAKESIRDSFGLELTVIEQVHLRHYVDDIAQEMQGNLQPDPTDLYNLYYPADEAANRFMKHYYGFDVLTMVGQALDIVLDNREGFTDYMRRLQEEAHMP